MMSLTFGLFTQVSGSGPLGPLVYVMSKELSGKLSCMLKVLFVSQLTFEIP